MRTARHSTLFGRSSTIGCRLIRNRRSNADAVARSIGAPGPYAACTLAGYPDKLSHDFRRSAVRNLVRAGIPERLAMTMTGHKTRSVFDRYNIVADTDQREAAEKLQDYYTASQQRGKARKVKQFKRKLPDEASSYLAVCNTFSNRS